MAIILTVIILAVIAHKRSSAALYRPSAEAERQRTPLDMQCELIGKTLESQGIGIVRSARTHAHCHLEVRIADQVAQAQRILIYKSQALLSRAYQEGLDSLSVFHLKPSPRPTETRFDADINADGQCVNRLDR
jgi:hypothetical protein